MGKDVGAGDLVGDGADLADGSGDDDGLRGDGLGKCSGLGDGGGGHGQVDCCCWCLGDGNDDGCPSAGNAEEIGREALGIDKSGQSHEGDTSGGGGEHGCSEVEWSNGRRAGKCSEWNAGARRNGGSEERMRVAMPIIYYSCGGWGSGGWDEDGPTFLF